MNVYISAPHNKCTAFKYSNGSMWFGTFAQTQMEIHSFAPGRLSRRCGQMHEPGAVRLTRVVNIYGAPRGWTKTKPWRERCVCKLNWGMARTAKNWTRLAQKPFLLSACNELVWEIYTQTVRRSRPVFLPPNTIASAFITGLWLLLCRIIDTWERRTAFRWICSGSLPN